VVRDADVAAISNGIRYKSVQNTATLWPQSFGQKPMVLNNKQIYPYPNRTTDCASDALCECKSLKTLEEGGRGLHRELEILVGILSKLLILRVVSADGIEPSAY